jgi:hypothetical protein
VKIVLATAVATSLLAQPVLAAGYTNVWSTGFETSEYETLGPFPWSSLSTIFGGASFDNAGSGPGLGTRYFHNTTGGTTIFTANGLGAHDSLKLSFDLIFVDSWDGNDGSCCSPDYLFANINGASDAYYASIALGSSDYFGLGTLSAFGNYLSNPSWNDKIVHYDLIIPHTASSFFLSFNAGGGGFQYGTDESWGIDNFSLSARTDVPEPASWAMLIAGFGLTGAVMRRRRMAAVA